MIWGDFKAKHTEWPLDKEVGQRVDQGKFVSCSPGQSGHQDSNWLLCMFKSLHIHEGRWKVPQKNIR